MKYELLKELHSGIIIDQMPVLRDIKDTFKVSFLLPSSGAYIALFTGEDNIERKVIIQNNTAIVPKELLQKDQTISLVVCQLDGEKILQSWECKGLQINSFLHMRQSQRQLSVSLKESDILHKLARLEKEIVMLKSERTKAAELEQKREQARSERLTKIEDSIKSLTAATEKIDIVAKQVDKNAGTIGSVLDEFQAIKSEF